VVWCILITSYESAGWVFGTHRDETIQVWGHGPHPTRG
jgi:hypothetical protein